MYKRQVYKTVLYWSEKTADAGYVFLLESRFHVRRLPVHTAQSGSLLNIADKIHCLNWSPESNLFPLSDNGTDCPFCTGSKEYLSLIHI